MASVPNEGEIHLQVMPCSDINDRAYVEVTLLKVTSKAKRQT